MTDWTWVLFLLWLCYISFHVWGFKHVQTLSLKNHLKHHLFPDSPSFHSEVVSSSSESYSLPLVLFACLKYSCRSISQKEAETQMLRVSEVRWQPCPLVLTWICWCSTETNTAWGLSTIEVYTSVTWAEVALTRLILQGERSIALRGGSSSEPSYGGWYPWFVSARILLIWIFFQMQVFVFVVFCFFICLCSYFA